MALLRPSSPVAEAAQRLAAAGLTRLHVLEGGLPALVAAGAPVVRGRGRWAMDRQVRLTAGGLVLLGALASLVLPAALAVPLGVGAGLTRSAVRDSCAMGALLARLPYDRGPAAPSRHDVVARLDEARRAA